ncbi:MAG TPA: hypothetical protein VHB20_07400 [Verrucomicrobiae bacterium]|jgi:hypothetical protein|nr:hypothetical protein [Verrucomicrobiae bacterium]
MDLLLESALTPAAAELVSGEMAGRSLEEWNAAYAKVERYLCALRLRNKVVLAQLALGVLRRAMQRAPYERQLSATELAVEEMDHLITDWFADILGESVTGTDQMLSTRGRLALLLADMPGKWQDQFLTPAPWPPEFVAAMREAFLRAGPDFQLARMAPRPLDLGPVATLVNFSRAPYFKLALFIVWLAFAAGLALLFIRTHKL